MYFNEQKSSLKIIKLDRRHQMFGSGLQDLSSGGTVFWCWSIPLLLLVELDG